jgi:hypothetical protein
VLHENESVVALQHSTYISFVAIDSRPIGVIGASPTEGDDTMNNTYIRPDFAVIEEHIRRARIERAVVVSQLVVGGIQAAVRGLRALKASIESNFRRVDATQRAIASDALMGRSVPRY